MRCRVQTPALHKYSTAAPREREEDKKERLNQKLEVEISFEI